MGIEVLEIDEERIPKERLPSYTFPLHITAGRQGDVIIETLPPVSRFKIFGKTQVVKPRIITVMSRIIETKTVDHVLSSGQAEERKLFRLAWDHPEDVYRYWNYAKQVTGNVFVLGVGLGLFVRMALLRAKEIAIVEMDHDIWRLISTGALFQGITSNCSINWNEPSEKLSHTEAILALGKRYKGDLHYAFLDPFPDLGSDSSMLSYLHLPEIHSMIHVLRPSMRSSGKILVKGYSQMMQSWQIKCQLMAHELSGTFEPFVSLVSQVKNPMEQAFVNWALKNRKRVVEKRDYKFINAWARSYVHL